MRSQNTLLLASPKSFKSELPADTPQSRNSRNRKTPAVQGQVLQSSLASGSGTSRALWGHEKSSVLTKALPGLSGSVTDDISAMGADSFPAEKLGQPVLHNKNQPKKKKNLQNRVLPLPLYSVESLLVLTLRT